MKKKASYKVMVADPVKFLYVGAVNKEFNYKICLCSLCKQIRMKSWTMNVRINEAIKDMHRQNYLQRKHGQVRKRVSIKLQDRS